MENYPNFNIDKAEIIEKKGNKYYIIPENTLIYRGGNISDLQDNAFFGFNKEHVKQYGNVSEYKINKQLEVLALMEINSNSEFYKSAPLKIKSALNNAFSINESRKIRVSNPSDDYAIINHLCKKKYNGYAMHSNYKTDSGSNFHAELVICNCTQHIDLMNANIESGGPPRIKRKGKMNYPSLTEINNVSPPRLLQTSTSLLQTPPKSPSTPVQRRLFGGKSKRKSKRKKKRRRNRRTKKVKH